jgi:hypothetical protein
LAVSLEVAVALAAWPDSGKFDDGTAGLTKMASWLNANLEALPAGQCSLRKKPP